MKLAKAAAAVAALLATDAKPSEAAIMAAIIAADKKGKDNEGLGPKEMEEKDHGADRKGKDEKDDPEHTNDEWEDKDEKKGKDKKAKDKKAKDMNDDPEHTNDEDIEGEGEVDGEDDIQPKKSANGNSGMGGAEPAKDKKGMDAAIKSAIDARDALHAARRDVESVLGIVTFDSAADVYKAALEKLGVATDGVHASAFPVMFKLARDKADAQAPTLASDSATVKTMAGLIPGYSRLK